VAADDSHDDRRLTVPDLIRLAGEHSELSIPLKEYFEALRAGDERLRAADSLFMEERDRRYAEVNIEKEKALKIKETADLAALQLAREIQTYKDEKANELREQISQERGLYVTRDQLEGSIRELKALIAPLTEYAQGTAGRDRGAEGQRTETRLNQGQIAAYGLLLVAIITLILLYATKK
jgi:hypothetical protein